MRRRRSGRQRRARRGFALLAVLGMLVGVSALALVMEFAARASTATAANRLALARARWRAEGCLEITRAAIADVMDARAAWLVAPATWTTLDQAVGAAPVVTESGCAVTLRPVGDAIDVNTADGQVLRTLFRAAGLSPLTSDSLADAILDWQGSTYGLMRPRDAAAAHGARPRHGPVADVRELRQVPGYMEALARVPALDTLLTTEPGRVVIARAPLAVLATLPGFTDEALARVLEMRARGVTAIDQMSLRAAVSPAARAELGGPVMQSVSRIASEPDAWIVTAHGASGTAPDVGAWIQVRLVHAGPRAAIIERRTWP